MGIDVELVFVEVTILADEIRVMSLYVVHRRAIRLTDDVHHALDAELPALRGMLVWKVQPHLGVGYLLGKFVEPARVQEDLLQRRRLHIG